MVVVGQCEVGGPARRSGSSRKGAVEHGAYEVRMLTGASLAHPLAEIQERTRAFCGAHRTHDSANRMAQDHASASAGGTHPPRACSSRSAIAIVT